MKFARTGYGRIKPFALLLVFMGMLALVIFLLAPQLGQTLNLTRRYGANPDNWVYYVILGGCALVLGGSLFLLFHGNKKSSRHEGSPD